VPVLLSARVRQRQERADEKEGVMIPEEKNIIKIEAREMVAKMTDSMARELLCQFLIRRAFDGLEMREYDAKIHYEASEVITYLLITEAAL
jgi:hypothetical protein